MLAVVALASLVAAELASAEAERAARSSGARLMAQFASQVDHGLRLTLDSRLSVVEATAAQLARAADKSGDALRAHLDAVQAEFPEFAWLGVADAYGKVVSSTDDALHGESVTQRAWFSAGRAAPYLGVAYDVTPRQGAIPMPNGAPARFVALAAPMRRADGGLVGVVAAYLSWDWIERLQTGLLGALDTNRRLELIVADRDGVVMVGPKQWLGRTVHGADDLAEGGAFIVGLHEAKHAGGQQGLGWRVAVRQAADAALGQAWAVRRTVFATVLLAGLLAALSAFALTQWLTRRLAALASEAVAVRLGRRDGLSVPPGQDEVSRIGATIAALVEHLQREKAALAQLNAELDARVAERTARIERMAEEARHAAVTRERLRMARDLHDTLAHSLMALLTQLRLLRKLKGKLAADEFDAELARAEQVAASGLGEARAAITQLRHGTVREQGLGAALRELVSRFGERTGVAATLRARGWAADLADARAETLYRIVEEALRNVERHAHARAVTVEIDDEPTAPASSADPTPRARVVVRDDGVGFDTAAPRPGHYGLLGIREQAELIGANLQVHSAPGRGTEVRLLIAP